MRFENHGSRTQAIPTKTGVVTIKPNAFAEIEEPQLTEAMTEALHKNGVKIRSADEEKSRTEIVAELSARAAELGIDVKPQWGVPALQRAIDSRLQELAEEEAAKKAAEGEGAQ